MAYMHTVKGHPWRANGLHAHSKGAPPGAPMAYMHTVKGHPLARQWLHQAAYIYTVKGAPPTRMVHRWLPLDGLPTTHLWPPYKGPPSHLPLSAKIIKRNPLNTIVHYTHKRHSMHFAIAHHESHVMV